MKTFTETVESKVKAEMRFAVNFNNFINSDSDRFTRTMDRLFGFVQGISSICSEPVQDKVSQLWDDFRTDVYILRGVYKPEFWKRIPDVFESKLD